MLVLNEDRTVCHRNSLDLKLKKEKNFFKKVKKQIKYYL